MFKRFFRKKEIELTYEGSREGEMFPKFRYHKDVMSTGIVSKKTIVCECCNKLSEYFVEQPLYSVKDVESLCPWCVADGQAAEKYNGTFIDLHSSEKVNDNAIIEELIKRNPSYPSWQENVWLSHCNDYCLYIKTVLWDDINDIKDELSNDFKRISAELGLSIEELTDRIKNDHSLVVHLFTCIHCGKHRIHAEWD